MTGILDELRLTGQGILSNIEADPQYQALKGVYGGAAEKASEYAQKMWNNMHGMDQAALATSPIPVVGDVMGAAADARMYYQEPESRTWGNAALSGLGLLPWLPNAAIVKAYHGSPVGRNIDQLDLDAPMQTDYGFLGSAVYASPHDYVAKAYTRNDYDGAVLSLESAAEKFKDFDYFPDQESYLKQITDFAEEIGVKSKHGTTEWAKEFREKMLEAGYEGSRGLNTDGSVAEYALYDPYQIKIIDKKPVY